MHYAISTTWGPTDTTRAALPFTFASFALKAGDTVLIMLFHDAVTIAIKGTHEQIKPAGPPPHFAEVFAHSNAEIIVCKACAVVRGITVDTLTDRCRFGGMNDFHVHASRDDTKIVSF